MLQAGEDNPVIRFEHAQSESDQFRLLATLKWIKQPVPANDEIVRSHGLAYYSRIA